MAAVTEVTAYQDSNGEVFATREKAEESQQRVGLYDLVEKLGMGRGGEWGPEMISKALWDNRGALSLIFEVVPYEAPLRVIPLNGHEIQSGLTRVAHAEGLIKQLPEDHDGRNDWLMNYGVRSEAVRKREKRGLAWDNTTHSAELI